MSVASHCQALGCKSLRKLEVAPIFHNDHRISLQREKRDQIVLVPSTHEKELSFCRYPYIHGLFCTFHGKGAPGSN